ncbi:E1 dh domain containing protein, partial [Asbolus verrucosus]
MMILQVPLGVGVAHKYNGTDGVCMTLYGDDVANQSQVFEVYNMAKLWNILCIFKELLQMRHIQEVMLFLEYRLMSGHSMTDPGTNYRTRNEIQEVRQTHDPITSFKEKITPTNLITADELK